MAGCLVAEVSCVVVADNVKQMQTYRKIGDMLQWAQWWRRERKQSQSGCVLEDSETVVAVEQQYIQSISSIRPMNWWSWNSKTAGECKRTVAHKLGANCTSHYAQVPVVTCTGGRGQ